MSILYRLQKTYDASSLERLRNQRAVREEQRMEKSIDAAVKRGDERVLLGTLKNYEDCLFLSKSTHMQGLLVFTSRK